MKKWVSFLYPLIVWGIVFFNSGCNPPAQILTAEPNEPAITSLEDRFPLSVCSFNIQFVGHFQKKDNETLSQILKGYDIVVIQELVAPPIDGFYPDGEPYSADPEALAFVQAMLNKGFGYILSEEDTGTGDKIHTSSSATEWWITFYDPNRVQYAPDLPHGFLAEDRSNNDNYERVPYAFPFRTTDNRLDFVLISVHLQPDDSKADQQRRQQELNAIHQWILDHNQQEKDYIILGDMNIKDEEELVQATPPGYLSLNDKCVSTNTNPNSPKPYDHVMYSSAYTTEMDIQAGLTVVNLIEAVRPYWTSPNPFPGDPYVHNEFRQYYSDHHPVVFRLNALEMDDD